MRSKVISQYLLKNLKEVEFKNLIHVLNFDIVIGTKGKYFYQAIKEVQFPHNKLKDFLKQYQATMSRQMKNRKFVPFEQDKQIFKIIVKA